MTSLSTCSSPATNYNIEIAGGIEAEVEAELGNIRQLPALPGTTEKKVLAANSAGAAYETLSLWTGRMKRLSC